MPLSCSQNLTHLNCSRYDAVYEWTLISQTQCILGILLYDTLMQILSNPYASTTIDFRQRSSAYRCCE